nr:hypothetical protein [uncultured Desulfuromonas sp.]
MRQRHQGLWEIIVSSLVMLLCGCTSQLSNPSVKTAPSCTQLWQQFDATVDKYSVRDTGSQPIDGFSYLRSDRFLANQMQTTQDIAAQRVLLQQMRQRDLAARNRELLRLPALEQQALRLLADSADTMAFKARLATCSLEMMRNDLADENVCSRLQQSIEVDDDYRFWQRAVGLYPLFVLPVNYLANNAHEEIHQQVSAFSEAEFPPQHLRWYAPQGQPLLSDKAVKIILQSSRENAAGLHDLNDDDRQRLAARFAPVIRQVYEKDSDLIGRIEVADKDHEPTFQTNPEQPVLYYYFSEIQLQGLAAVQINYVFWYPGRYNGESSWMERGHLDGITLRYTLNCQGRLVMVDLINNCGCYYGMVPDAGYFDLKNLKQDEKKEQILQTLPQITEGQRLLFTFSPRHLLLNAQVAPETTTARPYQLSPYEELELLPDGRGGYTSQFDQRGIVPGTRRVEAGLLFSMGIPEVGSMRQRGHQPITLVGREHFDDPQLFDRLFHYLQEPAGEEQSVCNQGAN